MGRKCAIVLWLDEPMSAKERAEIMASNHTAWENACSDHPNEKFTPMRDFWRENPRYGHRRLPSFATESHSVYMKMNPSDMSILDFLYPMEERDCEAMLKIVREQFPIDYDCEECAD